MESTFEIGELVHVKINGKIVNCIVLGNSKIFSLELLARCGKIIIAKSTYVIAFKHKTNAFDNFPE